MGGHDAPSWSPYGQRPLTPRDMASAESPSCTKRVAILVAACILWLVNSRRWIMPVTLVPVPRPLSWEPRGFTYRLSCGDCMYTDQQRPCPMPLFSLPLEAPWLPRLSSICFHFRVCFPRKLQLWGANLCQNSLRNGLRNSLWERHPGKRWSMTPGTCAPMQLC